MRPTSRIRGVVAILVQASHVKVSRCPVMEDPRRNYSFGQPGVRLGRLFVGDWAAAHSPWADQFDLIVNCCHKEGKYRRCHVILCLLTLTPKTSWSQGALQGPRQFSIPQASWSLGVWGPGSLGAFFRFPF